MSENRLLLIQCCHPPHLVFLARRLREKHPGRRIDAVLMDTPSNRARLEDLSHFDRVWFSRGRWPDEAPSAEHFEAVVFPLLGGGYRRLKKLRRVAGSKARACSWEADLRPFQRLEGWRTALRPPAPPDEFIHFMQDWPPFSLQGRVLLVDDSPSLRRVSNHAWEPFLSQAEQVEESRGGLFSEWRRLRQREFQGAVVFFGGERGSPGLRALPWLLGIPRTIVVDEGGLHDIERNRHWTRFWLRRLLARSSHSALVASVLFIQTEVPRYLIESVRRLRRRPVYRRSKVTVVCRQDDLQEIQQALPDCDLIAHSGRSPLDFWRLWKRARRAPAQVLCATFTGRPAFRPYKLLFFLLNRRRRLVFNAALESYRLTLRTLPRLFRRDDLLFGLDRTRQPDEILLVQTDDRERMEEVLKRLRDPKIISGTAPITVVCNQEKRGEFLDLPQVRDVVTYRRGDWTGYFRLLRRLRRHRADVAAALFSGRPTFRLSKLLFLLIRCRNRLIFNSHLECYYLGWRTWRHLLKRQRPGGDVVSHRLLLIQSEDDPEMLEAIKTVQDPGLPQVAQLFLLCREDRKAFFQAQPTVDRVVTYSKDRPLSNLGLRKELRGLHLDCVAAVFSGRPIFRSQKLLFFLAPASHRLVINENQDCFYFRLRRLDRFLTMHGNRNRHRLDLFQGALRLALKALLFFPRFFYLVIWLTYMRLRGAYSLKLEEAPERE
ncbi:MAG TPA: hypothetical protein VLV83_02120 [Acidobacteriota bacterium]|nr:hypothetical protein [Acidobacteriota bacterium]